MGPSRSSSSLGQIKREWWAEAVPRHEWQTGKDVLPRERASQLPPGTKSWELHTGAHACPHTKWAHLAAEAIPRNIRSHRVGHTEQVQAAFRVPPVKLSPEQTGFLSVFFGFRLLATFVRTPLPNHKPSFWPCLICLALDTCVLLVFLINFLNSKSRLS